MPAAVACRLVVCCTLIALLPRFLAGLSSQNNGFGLFRDFSGWLGARWPFPGIPTRTQNKDPASPSVFAVAQAAARERDRASGMAADAAAKTRGAAPLCRAEPEVVGLPAYAATSFFLQAPQPPTQFPEYPGFVTPVIRPP
jgi:hypothetical protein